jgi:hypothetical protein
MHEPGAAALLFERFDRLLSLADRFPQGRSRDRLRRSVCESIEAGTVQLRHERLERLLGDVARITPVDGVEPALISAFRAVVRTILNDTQTS